MYICNFSVSLTVNILHKFFHTLYIVGAYCCAIMMYIINGHYWQLTVHQLHDIGIIKIGTDNCDSLKIPVSAMFVIGHLPILITGIDKGNIISLFFCLHFQSIQYSGEIFMGQTTSCFFFEENSYIIGTVRF